MNRPARLPLALLPVTLLIGAGLLLTGCGGNSDDSSGSVGMARDSGSSDADGQSSADERAGATAQSERSAGGVAVEGVTGGSASGTSSFASVSVDGSAVVRTAEIGVRVEDLRAAADEAGRIARDAGGGVASERSDASPVGGYASAELSLRVLPERFDDVLNALAGLGEERSRTVSTDEVGDELVDLESRLATQRASVERVRALLAEATDLGQIVQIEGELTRRTAELESLQARLAALQDRVTMSTVVVRLDTEDAPPASADAPGFLDGLRAGWAAFVTTARAIAAVTGAVLPFLPLLALAVWGVLRARRRRLPPSVASVS